MTQSNDELICQAFGLRTQDLVFIRSNAGGEKNIQILLRAQKIIQNLVNLDFSALQIATIADGTNVDDDLIFRLNSDDLKNIQTAFELLNMDHESILQVVSNIVNSPAEEEQAYQHPRRP